jgi:hypothetical protein
MQQSEDKMGEELSSVETDNKEQEKEVEKLPVVTTEPEVPKASWFWMKNSAGNASASITFVAVAFVIVALSYIASMFVKIGPVELRAFDPGACSAFLIPLIGLYGTRRFTEAKFAGKS